MRHLHILGIAEPSSFGVYSPAAPATLRTWLVRRAILPQSPGKGLMTRDLVKFLLTPRASVQGFWGFPSLVAPGSNGRLGQDLPPVMSEPLIFSLSSSKRGQLQIARYIAATTYKEMLAAVPLKSKQRRIIT